MANDQWLTIRDAIFKATNKHIKKVKQFKKKNITAPTTKAKIIILIAKLVHHTAKENIDKSILSQIKKIITVLQNTNILIPDFPKENTSKQIWLNIVKEIKLYTQKVYKIQLWLFQTKQINHFTKQRIFVLTENKK